MGCREADEEPKGGEETGVCQWARGKEKIGRFACKAIDFFFKKELFLHVR